MKFDVYLSVAVFATANAFGITRQTKSVQSENFKLYWKLIHDDKSNAILDDTSTAVLDVMRGTQTKRLIDKFISTVRATNFTDEASHDIILSEIKEIYLKQGIDSRYSTSPQYNGDWILEGKVSFPGNLGKNEKGEDLYLLGRLSHKMIQPHDLVCSIQKITKHISFMSDNHSNFDENGKIILPDAIPSSLRRDLEDNASGLRYDRTDTHFTIEKNGLQGILQMDAYVIPNPEIKNQYTFWFTGGRCYAYENVDKRKWREIFGGNLPRRSISDKIKLCFARILMGASPSKGLLEDDTLRFTFNRPIGGHDVAYHQVVYLDDNIKVTVGNRGTTVSMSRI